MKTKDEYLTRREVSEKFKVHESTVFRWRQKGVLPAYGIEGKVLYKLSDVENLLIKL